MFTFNICFIIFNENERGSHEAGKIVNMVISFENPYKFNKLHFKI